MARARILRKLKRSVRPIMETYGAYRYVDR